MEAKLKAAGMKVFELTSAMENMQKNNDALQRKVATPVQVQILDKSPVAGQQQVRPWSPCVGLCFRRVRWFVYRGCVSECVYRWIVTD